MARFYGPVGYATVEETSPGVWEDVIVEKNYYGDVLRNTRANQSGEQLHDDLTVGNRISIVADAYAYDHFFDMRWIEWAGVRWIVKDVEVENPRLVLSLGGVYNGP
mgnify:CR=1 FL=1